MEQTFCSPPRCYQTTIATLCTSTTRSKDSIPSELAKPFYNDIFFETMFLDVLPDALENIFESELEEDFISVNVLLKVDNIA